MSTIIQTTNKLYSEQSTYIIKEYNWIQSSV